MASAVVNSNMSPRAISAAPKLPNIPVIEHPNSRMGNGKDLNVIGSAEPTGSRTIRERSFVTMREDGKMELGMEHASLPPVGRVRPNRERMLTWPPEHLLPSNMDRAARIQKRRMMNVVCHKKTITAEELEVVLAEKVSTGQHSLKHLFKANDPTGHGSISREALMRIVFSLCGYITPDIYNKLLKRIGLRHVKSVSFDEFIGCFKRVEPDSNREWLRPSNAKDIYLPKHHPEEHLREQHVFPREQFVPASYITALLKAQASKGAINLNEYFPAVCLEKDGIILPPQFREAIAILGYHLTDDEFRKLWSRFDLEGVGSLKTRTLFKLLDLDTTGIPKVQMSPRKSKSSMSQIEAEKAEVEVPSSQPVPKRKNKMKHLDNVLDQIMFKMDMPHNQLLIAFEAFDFLADNCVARVDFRKILLEFGMPVTAMELEHFLSRANIRVRNGVINYREFLSKFSNRSEGGIVSRIVNDRFHVFDKKSKDSDSDSLTAEQLEAKVVEFLHKDFLKILGRLQAIDQYNMGVVTQMEFKRIVESCLRLRMKERHWEKLRDHVGVDGDGLVPYYNFLDMIVAGSGSWNQKKVAGHTVAKTDRIDTPPQVLRLRLAEKERELKESQMGRTAEQLLAVLRDEFKSKLHICNKAYRKLDPKMTSRLGKEQLNKVLDGIGVTFIPQELDRLFKYFEVPSDGLFTWTNFLAYVTKPSGMQPSNSNAKIEVKVVLPNDGSPRRPKTMEKNNNDVDTMAITPREDTVSKNKVSAQARAQSALIDSLKLGKKGPRAVIRENLLEKIREDVIANWDHLKYIFRQLDPEGVAAVSAIDMKECLKTFEFNLNDEEMNHLCERYDFTKDGRFHYMPFMESYTAKSQQKSQEPKAAMVPPPPEVKQDSFFMQSANSEPREPLVYNRQTHRVRERQGSATSWATLNPTVDQVIHMIGEQMVKEWKSLRRAFKKADADNKGYLTVTEFRTVVENCGIRLSEDDLYHIMCEFDANMDGKICYEEFIQSVLKN